MRRDWPLYLLILALAGALIAWNAVPLRDHSLHIRTSDLSFVPDPVLARMLNLGQNGAASKLQWIDSFSYFELQLDKRDDTLRGSGQSGFERLYTQLTAEDPYYGPFYEHASFNIGALTGRHDISLGFLLRGLSYMPHATQLWRQAAAELYASYDFDKRHPDEMNAFLDAWAENELDYVQRRQVWDWKNAMARRHDMGLGQLTYWQEQMHLYPPDSPGGRYIDNAMREEVAHYGVRELEALLYAYREHYIMAPLQLSEVLAPQLVRERFPMGLNVYLPYTIADHQLVLRDDPYGYPFLLIDGQVVSPGLQQRVFGPRPGKLLQNIGEYLAKHPQVPFPQDLETVRALGIEVPALAPQAHYLFTPAAHSITVSWDPPPGRPWPLTQQAGHLQH